MRVCLKGVDRLVNVKNVPPWDTHIDGRADFGAFFPELPGKSYLLRSKLPHLCHSRFVDTAFALERITVGYASVFPDLAPAMYRCFCPGTPASDARHAKGEAQLLILPFLHNKYQ